jgi:hypothetical protein
MPPGNADARTSPLYAMVEPWFEAWRFASAMTWSSAASIWRLSDPQRLRKTWSSELTGMIDRSLRSPEFLRLMACNLRVLADIGALTSHRPR